MVPLVCPLPSRERAECVSIPGEGAARSADEAIAEMVRGLAYRNLLDRAPPERGAWKAA
jgi:hypothetical protein